MARAVRGRICPGPAGGLVVLAVICSMVSSTCLASSSQRLMLRWLHQHVAAASASSPGNATGPTSVVINDRECSDKEFAIVLAHYKEGDTEVQETVHKLRAVFAAHKPCVHIFTKGPVNATVLRSRLDLGHAVHVHELPNIGREGHTYITYIVHHWSRLPHRILFAQASPDGEGFWSRVQEAAKYSDAFACLGYDATMSKCDHASMPGSMVRLREIWAMTQHSFCPPVVHICYRGQFIVSSAAVHHQPLSFYKFMLEYLEAPPDHFVHEDIEEIDHRDTFYTFFQAARHTRDNTLAGHVLERMFMTIFSCQPPALDLHRPWACPNITAPPVPQHHHHHHHHHDSNGHFTNAGADAAG